MGHLPYIRRVRRLLALLLVSALLLPLLANPLAGAAPALDAARANGRLLTISTFSDGSSSVLLHHEGFDFNATSVDIPHNVTVVDATLHLRGEASGPNITDLPHNVSLDIGDDNIPDFVFAGSGYGGMGLQHLLVNDNSSQTVYVPAAQPNGTSLYLPKGSTISAATLNLTGMFELSRDWTKMEGSKEDADLAASLSNVGDLNGDGSEDLAIGIPYDDRLASRAGAVQLYWGGSPIDLDSPNMTLLPPPWDSTEFGFSVAGGSDLNGDGEPDLVVGAPGYSPRWYGCPFGICGIYPWQQMGAIFYYWGGSALDATADLRADADGLIGTLGRCETGNVGERMGESLGLGDVDGDGWDDVVASASHVRQDMLSDMTCPGYVPPPDLFPGGITVISGGPGIDNWTDYSFNATDQTDLFGSAVTVLDFQDDGIDDIVTSGPTAGASLEGKVHLILGGSPLVLDFDATWVGTTVNGSLGRAIGSPGDVDGDGIEDLLLGEPYAQTGVDAQAQPLLNGTVVLILGDAGMDTAVDHTFAGTQHRAGFGTGLGLVGDVTGDGLADFSIQSAYWTKSPLPVDENVGRFDLYASALGTHPSDLPIYTIIGDDPLSEFGANAAGGIDLNGDGFTDFVLGAPKYDGAAGNNTGAIFLIETIPARPTDPSLRLGPAGALLWSHPGVWFDTVVLDDGSASLSTRLQTYLDSAPSAFTDASGNAMVEVPLTLGSTTAAHLRVEAVVVRYAYTASVHGASGNLSAELDALLMHRPFGIPLHLAIETFSSSAGDLLLDALALTLDPMPYEVGLIDEVAVPEDTFEPQAAALSDLYRDDDGPVLYTLTNITGDPPVAAYLADGYLAIDAATGPENDNWTGAFKVLITAADSANATLVPEYTKVRILPINDRPIIVSVPKRTTVAGTLYEYKLWADDAESDPLTWSLGEGPLGMTLDADAAKLVWNTTEADVGSYPISVSVSDGNLSDVQQYVLKVVPPNTPPRFLAALPDIAHVGYTYQPKVQVTDDDGDALTVALALGPPVMEYVPESGRLEWVPTATGTTEVHVNVSDGLAVAWQNYTLTVTDTVSNRLPIISSLPPTSGTVGHRYRYEIAASDPDGDALSYRLKGGLSGMTLTSNDSRAALLEWTPTPGQSGSFPLRIDVDDGKGFSQQRWQLMVTDQGANALPIFRNTPPTQATVGYTYLHDADAFDPDGAPITFSVESGTPQMSIDPSTGVLEWSPLFADAGEVVLTLRADDGIGYSRQATTIEVSQVGANHLPQLLNAPPTTASVGTSYLWSALVDDPDGDVVSATFLPTPVDARLQGMEVRWLVVPEDPRHVSMGLRLSDGKGFIDVRWTVEVRGGYDGPFEPSVSFTAPSNNSKVSGDAVHIEGLAATPLREILRVELRVGDGPWFVVNGTLSWSYDLDSTTYDDGALVIHARAQTSKETSPEATLTLQVDNIPAEEDTRIQTGLGLGPFEWFLLLLLSAVIIGAILIHRQRQRRDIDEALEAQRLEEEEAEHDPPVRPTPPQPTGRHPAGGAAVRPTTRRRAAAPAPVRPPVAADPYADAPEEEWSDQAWSEEPDEPPAAPVRRPAPPRRRT